MSRPTFTETIRALTLTDPSGQPLHTPEEADIAELLRHIEAEHRAPQIGVGQWGPCVACREPWPCPAWNEADHLGLLYLGRAHDRVAARARRTLDRLAQRDRAARSHV